MLQREWPGDFEYGLRHGGPAAATWVAFAGGAGAIVVGFLFRHRHVRERPGRASLAATLFVTPVAVHAFAHWTPALPVDNHPLPVAVVRELRAVPPRAVVIADPLASYRIAAAAPVYIVAAPPVHVANTEANRPYERQADVARWLRTGDPAIPRRYGATWALQGGRLYRLTP